MARKNAFILRSEHARSLLMKWTGMDELDYQLAILESGCFYLDQLVKPLYTISEELPKEYREYLTAIGYWRCYEWIFRTFEQAVVVNWTRPDALELQQPKEWLRERLLEEARGLPWNQAASNQLDYWLKSMAPLRGKSAEEAQQYLQQQQQQPKTEKSHVH